MALLFNVTPLSSLSSAPSSATGQTALPFLRLCNSSIALHPNLSFVGCIKQAPLVLGNRGGSLVVRASSDVDGTGSNENDAPAPPTDSKEDSVPIEKLLLESRLDQKLRMKMAKKIRLRRKRLVRKRHLRKKGRWPPSKLKKNRNV